MKMAHIKMLAFFTVLFLSMYILVLADEVVLKIDPTNKAVEPGDNITFKCMHYPADKKADNKLQWYFHGQDTPIAILLQNKTFVNQTQYDVVNGTKFESRYSSTNGSLTIKNATFSDANTFVCKTPDGTLTRETVLKVYNMPSYFTEGMIVVGINLGLVFVFILCSIWSFMRNRREKREVRRKHKLGHKEMAKRIMNA